MSTPRLAAAALRAGVQREDSEPAVTESELQAMIDAAMAAALDPVEADHTSEAESKETTAADAFIPDAEDRRLLKRVRRELAERGREVDHAALLRAGVRVIASLDRDVLGVVLDNLPSAHAPADKAAKDGKKDKPHKKDKAKGKGRA